MSRHNGLAATPNQRSKPLRSRNADISNEESQEAISFRRTRVSRRGFNDSIF